MVAAASSNDVAPGTLGFLVVFGMAVVLFFLFRSLTKHLRKVNAAARKDQADGSPESKSDDDDDNADATAASSGAPGPGDRRRDS
jgi:hypothetical protein